MDEAFRTEMTEGYATDEPVAVIGCPMLEGEILSEVRVGLPLSTANRHGLVAGATGTGKTKTLQVLAGQLSAAGVPVFVADVKGDLTGLAVPGDAATRGSASAPSRSTGRSRRPPTRSSRCRSRVRSGRRSAPRSARSGPCSSARSWT